MKHAFLYKILFFFCIATVGTQSSVAQNTQYVTGNKYSTLSGSTFTPTVTASGFSSINNAIGSRSTNNYATATSTTASMDFYAERLSSFTIYHTTDRNSSNTRPQSVSIYVSDAEGSFPANAQQSVNITSNTQTVTLTTPVTGKYVRLEFTYSNTNGRLYGITFTVNSDAIAIMHKASKWHKSRDSLSTAVKELDRFDDDIKFYTLQDGVTQVQASHTYIDTIYVHKGTSVTLTLPDYLDEANSINSYQRWHSFRTDGTFRTNQTGNDAVQDLLTPISSGTFYRFGNGYVGGNAVGGGHMLQANFYVPTDDEFDTWFPDETSAIDKNYYLVACDVSGYTDYNDDGSPGSTFFSGTGSCYEPTLAHRVIFYIMTVDKRDTYTGDIYDGNTETWKKGHMRLKDTNYQGATDSNLDEKKFLEEYDISFPYTRVSDNSLEMVALSKNIDAYAIPDVSESVRDTTMNVGLVNNSAGISLPKNFISKYYGNRIIQFNYPETNSDKTQYVNADGSTATIYVTKTVGGTTYNIARFNLTFVRDTRQLTQTQLEKIEAGTIEDENLKYYQFRTESYLEENYEKLTELNFDYDTSLDNNDFYPYPIKWDASSYAFYDGSQDDYYAPSSGSRYFPEWGYYSIMSGFMEANSTWVGTDTKYDHGSGRNNAKALPGSTYHMYIDASDRPGIIARLPFREKLCPGSELFVTAWVKGSGWSSESADGAMLFSVMGVTTDDVGQDLYVPLYRHSTGQIRRTDYLTGGMPGTGTDTNEWMQVYFSFVVENNIDYSNYVLQIDNNSSSTDGGDYYLDNINVYVAKPSAVVTQLEYACTGDLTLLNIKLDRERLLASIGDTGLEKETDAIDYCFIDKAKYDEYLAKNAGDYAGAVEASAVEVGNNETGADAYQEKYNTMYFYIDFDDEKNTNYDDGSHPHLARNNYAEDESGNRTYFFYTTEASGVEAYTVDFYSALTPNRTYMMLVQPHKDGVNATAETFNYSLDDPCAISTTFTVTSQTLLKVNGEVVDPTTDFCQGQVFNFSAIMRVPIEREDGLYDYKEISDGVYFDWFFGTEEEFISEDNDYKVSLDEALLHFRNIFPDKEKIDDEVVAGEYEKEGSTEKLTLTQNEIDIIKYYNEEAEKQEGGTNPRLVLHKERLDITIREEGLTLVIQPIPTDIPPGEDGITTEQWARVCWEYIPLTLNATGAAPRLYTGFDIFNYPEGLNPCLRIGIKQIEATSADNTLTISLSRAEYASENVDHLGLITAESAKEAYNKIYLVGTDDPAYTDFIAAGDFNQYSLPIGTITDLHAEPYSPQTTANNLMHIYFDTETTQDNGFKFTPKEGYTYTFAVHFTEQGSSAGDDIQSSCYGSMNIDMKVVPENLVWKGTETTNWNNDDYWVRADKADLKKADSDSYVTNAEYFGDNDAKGFVPMSFSNVVMPEDSKARLYIAGYLQGGEGQTWNWTNQGNRPADMGDPTENIQYDLMVYEVDGALTTRRYRVNICNDIHFSKGAQMLHAEQLIYNTAWMDIPVETGKWTAVSVPLKDTYAGDWYTPTATGTQGTELFKDITFDASVNNRLNPAVFQRTLSGSATIIENGTGQSPASFNTVWSSVYNDASVVYTPGGGFSIKALSNNSSLVFRFPKADIEYDVATLPGILRPNKGELLVSDMVDRSNVANYQETGIMPTLFPTKDGKYLMVGNPYMAPMAVQTFVYANSANDGVLEPKYWYRDENGDIKEDAYSEGTGGTDGSEATEAGWTLDKTYLAPPYSAFWVKVKDSETAATQGVTVKFEPGMQEFSTGSDGTSSSALTITAASDNGTSRAALRYATGADNAYGPEDAEIITGLTGETSDAPVVYTAAGNTATGINQVKDARRIPLGVFADQGEAVTLTFSNVEAVLDASLYDAELQTETPLYDGYSMTVSGPSHGRYFILGEGRGTTGISEVTADCNVSVSSVVPRQLIVTSGSDLLSISVWSAGGALLKKVSVGGNRTCTLNDVNSGMAVVRTETSTGTDVTKVMVR